VGEVTKKQVEEIAKIKFEDLNAYDLESASRIIEGTAKSMGIIVTQ
jgi:large subunit ribosomal protein L11